MFSKKIQLPGLTEVVVEIDHMNMITCALFACQSQPPVHNSSLSDVKVVRWSALYYLWSKKKERGETSSVGTAKLTQRVD